MIVPMNMGLNRNPGSARSVGDSAQRSASSQFKSAARDDGVTMYSVIKNEPGSSKDSETALW